MSKLAGPSQNSAGLAVLIHTPHSQEAPTSDGTKGRRCRTTFGHDSRRYQGTQQARLHFFLQQFDRHEHCRPILISTGASGFGTKASWTSSGLLTNLSRGSYSLMAAAMDRITPMHQSEMSVEQAGSDYRNPANRDVHARERAGRVDLWSCYNGFEYFLEFKRAASESPRKIHG